MRKEYLGGLLAIEVIEDEQTNKAYFRIHINRLWLMFIIAAVVTAILITIRITG